MEEILHISTDTNQSHISIGSTSGYSIYTVWPFALKHKEDTGPCSFAELFPHKPLIALLNPTSPSLLVIRDFNAGANIRILSFSLPISLVAISPSYLLASMSHFIVLYSSDSLEVVDSIEFSGSPDHLALSPSLPYLVTSSGGKVKVWGLPFKQITEFSAHRAALTALGVSSKGNRVATASHKGTIIRIFNLPSGDKLMTFKRGMMPVHTFALSFSRTGNFLVSTSDSGTCHIFAIGAEQCEERGVVSLFKNSLLSAASYVLPDSYRDSFETSTSFVVARTNCKKMFKACLVENSGFLVVVSKDSTVTNFRVNLRNGGEANKESETSLTI